MSKLGLGRVQHPGMLRRPFDGTVSHIHYVSGEETSAFLPTRRRRGWRHAGMAAAARGPPRTRPLTRSTPTATARSTSRSSPRTLTKKLGHSQQEVDQIIASLDTQGRGPDGLISKSEWRAGFYKSYPVLVGMVDVGAVDWRDLHYNQPGRTIVEEATGRPMTELCSMRVAQLVDLRARTSTAGARPSGGRT